MTSTSCTRRTNGGFQHKQFPTQQHRVVALQRPFVEQKIAQVAPLGHQTRYRSVPFRSDRSWTPSHGGSPMYSTSGNTGGNLALWAKRRP